MKHLITPTRIASFFAGVGVLALSAGIFLHPTPAHADSGLGELCAMNCLTDAVPDKRMQCVMLQAFACPSSNQSSSSSGNSYDGEACYNSCMRSRAGAGAAAIAHCRQECR